ncbi:MAG: hypothetical protein GY774_02420 [Planctomycetes bacterium]|nr:hypothetical protein [Planctomycetota bacterium]
MCKKLTYLVPLVLVLALAGSASAELVLHLPFDEGSGAVTEDVSASGLQATLERDYQWTAGIFGQAVSFTDGHAEVSGDPLNLPQITVMAWVNPTSIQPELPPNHWTNHNNIYGKKGNNGDDSIGLSLTAGDGVFFYADTGADNLLYAPDAGVQTGQWQHIAATFDGTMMKIFLNGEQVGDMAAAGSDSIIEIFHPVRIGGNPDQGTLDFDGAIDDVKVFDQALTTGEIQQAMKSGSAGLASNPNPANEAADVPRDVVFGWTPGEFADLHDVYFGASFDDVNNATVTVDLTGVYLGRLSDSSYAVGERLDFSETYYWRIDEVNAPPDSTVFKGDVWSFTTEPVSYAIDGANITATASSSMAGSAPERTIDGSGLDDSDLHSTSPQDMWLSDMLGPQPTWIEYQFDKVYKLHEMSVWNQNQIIEPSIGYGFKDVSIEYSADGIAYTTLRTTHEFARGPGAAGYTANTNVDFGGAAAKYVKLTVNSGWESILTQYGLSEVRFSYIPVVAREPSPDSGATDADVDTFLSFRAGREASEHDVYFSSDMQTVIDETINPVRIPAGSSSASYDPGALDLNQTYYWKVNEVNEAESPATWQGDVWNFTTQEYLVVDDFESYNDLDPDDPASKRIFNVWLDGFDNPAINGSIVGHANPPFAEQTIVHSGLQSMPFVFDNAVGKSEATLTLTNQRDWTVNGVNTLTIWLRGDAANAAEPLYVVLNGNALVTNDNPNAAQESAWTEWNIDLQAFVDQGVNLANVDSITLGLGNRSNPVAGGAGMMFFDDILISRLAP